jgi:predicted RNase H-like HicB family nuclease
MLDFSYLTNMAFHNKTKISVKVKTDYGEFLCALQSEPDMDGYMVTVPKKPDVITWGKNVTHAKKMAKEAIECSIEGDVLIEAEKTGTVVFRNRKVVI